MCVDSEVALLLVLIAVCKINYNISSNEIRIIMIEILSFQPFVTPSSLPAYIMKDEEAGIFF